MKTITIERNVCELRPSREAYWRHTLGLRQATIANLGEAEDHVQAVANGQRVPAELERRREHASAPRRLRSGQPVHDA